MKVRSKQEASPALVLVPCCGGVLCPCMIRGGPSPLRIRKWRLRPNCGPCACCTLVLEFAGLGTESYALRAGCWVRMQTTTRSHPKPQRGLAASAVWTETCTSLQQAPLQMRARACHNLVNCYLSGPSGWATRARSCLLNAATVLAYSDAFARLWFSKALKSEPSSP